MAETDSQTKGEAPGRDHRPKLTIVIGTNGAGKSTWCSKHEDELPTAFYDADSIANSLGDWNDRHNQNQAARHVNRALRDHLASSESFGFESTYSGRSRPRLVERAARVRVEQDSHGSIHTPSASVPLPAAARRRRR